jgi:hypothetical protein
MLAWPLLVQQDFTQGHSGERPSLIIRRVDLSRRILRYGSVEFGRSRSCFNRWLPTLRVSCARGQDPGFEVDIEDDARNSESMIKAPKKGMNDRLVTFAQSRTRR